MSDFNKEKLIVELADDVTADGPIIPRRYTLTHSDETGDLCLSIGKYYDYSKVNYLRDEVLGCWVCKENGEYILKLQVLLDTCGEIDTTEKRDKIFRRELPLAITAIIYGDRKLFAAYEVLYECKLFIKFKSRYEKYNVEEQWGCVKDYKTEDCDDRFIINEVDNSLYRAMVDSEGDEIDVDQFKPMSIEENMINYPVPFPPGIEYPYPTGPKNKNVIVEKALINMVSSYIKNEVDVTMGKNTPFCLRQSEVLNAKVVATYGPCRQEYEITVGVKAGKTPPPYYNFVITLLISENKVTVKSVKNPREEI